MRTGEPGRLIERIMLAIAAGAAASSGCGDRARTVEVGSSGGETSPGTSTTGAWGNETSAGSSGDEGADMGPRFDVLELPDMPGEPPPPPECEPNDGPGDFVCSDPPPDSLVYLCVPPPIAGEGGCGYSPGDLLDVITQCAGYHGCSGPQDIACGPDPGEQDLCCYWVQVGGVCPGRPFVVDGRARLAARVRGPDWAVPVHPRVDDLDPVTRRALASAWAEQGSFEHAAVASFARFALHLLAVGAPPPLLAAAAQASADELSHARAFFGLASAYAGHALAPAALDVSGCLGPSTLASIAAATAAEGCIAETTSLLQLEAAHRACRDPVVASVIASIAEQERAHVELAWGFVAWALRRAEPEVRRAVERVFADPVRHLARGPRIDPRADPSALARHGQLGPRATDAIARRCLREIVMPCARHLLAAHVAGSDRAVPQRGTP